jgi:uncharacterized protein (TIGR00290 family)
MALAALRADPLVRVVGLLTTITSAYDRVSIHGVRRTILHAQASGLGLPVIEARIEPGADNAAYDASWGSAIAAARKSLGAIEAVAYGDLFLEDVRAFREEQAARHGYALVFPLWGEDTRALAHRFTDAGYEAYLTCVDTTQLDGSFAGRRFDTALLADLPASVDPCGERGEFHTCVVAGPTFRSPIRVQLGERVLRDRRFQYCDLIPANERAG